MRKFTNLELFNKGITKGGTVEQFITSNNEKINNSNDENVNIKEGHGSDNEEETDSSNSDSESDSDSDSDSDKDEDQDQDQDQDKTTPGGPTNTPLSSYDQISIKSGDPLIFTDASTSSSPSPPSSSPSNSNLSCITNGGGFAVVQQGLTAHHINLVKIGNHLHNNTNKSSNIRSRTKSASHRRKKDSKVSRERSEPATSYKYCHLWKTRNTTLNRSIPAAAKRRYGVGAIRPFTAEGDEVFEHPQGVVAEVGLPGERAKRTSLLEDEQRLGTVI